MNDMKVRHRFSGKMHHYSVTNEQGKEHNVIIQTFCDCDHEPFKGQGKLCCHVAAVMEAIVNEYTFLVGAKNEKD